MAEEKNGGQAPEQEQPQQGIDITMTVRWVNGKVTLQAPDDPIIFMKIMADAMNAYTFNKHQEALQNAGRIVKPGATHVDQRIIDAAKGKG